MTRVGLNLEGAERPYAYALDAVEDVIRRLVIHLGPAPAGVLDKLRNIALNSACDGLPLPVTKYDADGLLTDEPAAPTWRSAWDVPDDADWPQAVAVLQGALIEAASRDGAYNYMTHSYAARLLARCAEAERKETRLAGRVLEAATTEGERLAIN